MEILEGKDAAPISAGEQKVMEYVERVRGGESKDEILRDLPEGFRSGVEKKLAEPAKGVPKAAFAEVPPQYKGLSSEALDFIWVIPEYVDQNKTREEEMRKAQVLAGLREREGREKAVEARRAADQVKIAEIERKLGIAKPEPVAKNEESAEVAATKEAPAVSLEDRKKLHGWSASYELAKVAKQQEVDLSELSREDYAAFAIQNSLAIDDGQLRAAPWQRMATSVQEVVMGNRERKSKISAGAEQVFARFCYDIKQKAEQEDRFIRPGIKIRQGTKDSGSWLFFGINNGIGETESETYKSYVSVKDLNMLTPERFVDFMTSLRDGGYNGDVKIFQDLSEQGVRLNDQVVMHGASQADAELALRVAEVFFGADLDQKSVGKDEVVDGENKSYSQVLAMKIADAIRSQK